MRKFQNLSPILAAVILPVFSAVSHAQGQGWSIRMANTLMQRYPDPANYPTAGWSYPHGHLLEGFEKLRAYTGDKDSTYYKYILRYADRYVDNAGTLSGFSGVSMDDMMPGVAICWAYHQTRLTKYKTAADKIRASFRDYPRTADGAFWHMRNLSGQFWIDGVFMGEMFNLRYGQYIGDSDSCFNEATRQIKLAHKRLLKGTTNLLLHAWDESPVGNAWANQTTGLSPEIWGEGLGWYAAVLADALEAIPEVNKNYDTLATLMKELAAGLRSRQDSSGCWWDIVDKPAVGLNWLDVSGTSFFVYTLQKGIDLGILEKAVYDPVVKKGYQCLVQRKATVNTSGLVDIDYTCGNLPVQPNFDKYMNCGGTTVGVKGPNWMRNAKEATVAFFWAVTAVEKPGITASKHPSEKPFQPALMRWKRDGQVPGVYLRTECSGLVRLDIIAINGKKIGSAQEFVSTAGDHFLSLPVGSPALLDGIYFAIITVNGKRSFTRCNWVRSVD